jgi:PIN domain nuclease of toxin-antitoxin system
MIHLLDTHTFLWILNSPKLIPAKVQQVLQDSSAKLALSLVTPWEMAIKSNSGKLDADIVLDHFDALVHQGGYTLLETSVRQVVLSGRLPLHHKDPFDRLLAAQALDLHIPLISRDRVFDSYGVKRIWN